MQRTPTDSRAVGTAFLTVVLLATIATNATAAERSAHPLDAGERAWHAREWAAVVEAYQPLVHQNPVNGEFWFRLARGLYAAERYPESIAAYERALELGYNVRNSTFNIGAIYTETGRIEESAAWIDRALRIDAELHERVAESEHFGDVRGTTLYRERWAPRARGEVSRDVAWRADLRFLLDRIRESHWSPYRNTTAEAWEAEAATLERRIPELDDVQVIAAMMQLTARVGDGHTVLYPPVVELGGDYTFHALPLRLRHFPDGTYVVAAAPPYAQLAGLRLRAIGGRPIEALADAAGAWLPADNAMTLRWLSPMALITTELLRELGATGSLDAATLVLDGPDGPVERDVKTEPLSFAALDRVPPEGWARMAPIATTEAAPWLQRPNDTYWFEYRKAERVMYFQYNQVAEEDELPFEDFVAQLFRAIERRKVDALVIDIRLNNGGNSHLFPPLVKAILAHPEINQRGRLFTVIGRRTFSAAMNLASTLEQWTETLFVGEPTGSSPNFVGDDNVYRLPYSGLPVSISNAYHQGTDSADRRTWLAPDLLAELSAEDYRQGVDPAWETIRDYLGRR